MQQAIHCRSRGRGRTLCFDRHWPAWLALLGLGFWLGLDLARADDWPHWRGPSCNGISKETGWLTQWPASGPKRLWQVAVGQGYSSVSVSRGRLYTMGVVDKQETVWCLDAASGQVIWQQRYPYVFKPKYYDGGSSATPTVDGDRVYTLGQAGELRCFDAMSGQVVWAKNIQTELGAKLGTWGLASSPRVEGRVIILNLGAYGTAVDKATGNVRWTTGKSAGGYSSAVPYPHDGQRAVALSVAKSVVGVAVETGRKLWEYPWKTDWNVNAADPIPIGDRLFIASGYNHGCALLQLGGPTPKPVYTSKNMRNMFNACVLIDGFLYGVDGDNDKKSFLRCIALKDASVQWTFEDFQAGALMAADKHLIVQGKKGELALIAATPAACRVVARTQVLGGRCWTTPVLANGRIYCRNSRGDLVCLDVRGTQ